MILPQNPTYPAIVVSIPNGFSNLMQPELQHVPVGRRELVSIPNGFSNLMQPTLHGVLGRFLVYVSIPNGFSNLMQRYWTSAP